MMFRRGKALEQFSLMGGKSDNNRKRKGRTENSKQTIGKERDIVGTALVTRGTCQEDSAGNQSGGRNSHGKGLRRHEERERSVDRNDEVFAGGGELGEKCINTNTFLRRTRKTGIPEKSERRTNRGLLRETESPP